MSFLPFPPSNTTQSIEVLNQDVVLNENLLAIEEKLIDVRVKKLMFFKVSN
jgi:hypothetical protein